MAEPRAWRSVLLSSSIWRVQGEERVVVPVPAAEVVDCPVCGQGCNGSRMLATHLACVHGRMNWARAKIRATYCLACGVQFHTKSRLLHHVAYRPHRCAFAYATVVPGPSSDED
eukprot:5770247-Alexandrium_andersonii.AAC.1